MAILNIGSFETQVRAKLGVYDEELPDEDLNLPMIKDFAEAVVSKRVPDYGTITDTVDLLYLQNAVISYICHLVAPSMPRRLNTEVSTLDTKWKKASVNWEMMAQRFLLDFEESLGGITSVEVIDDSASASTVIVNIITHERETI